METTIQVKKTVENMEKTFERNGSIRHYEPTNKSFNFDEYDGEPIYFNVLVRHSENEDPKKLIKN
jgi:hypothetical protein